MRRAAGRLLVAGTPVRDLLLCAKHLFVAAICGSSRFIQTRSAAKATGSATFFQQCRARAAAAAVANAPTTRPHESSFFRMRTRGPT